MSGRIDAGALRPMIALPGDPGNGLFIDELGDRVRVDIAYAGSCTAGKKEDKMGQRASDTSDVLFEEVRVPETNRIGKEGEGFKIAMITLDYARPTVAAMAVVGREVRREVPLP